MNNNDFGPTEQQCLNSSNNIKDSTVIQNPPSNGGTDSFKVVDTNPSDGDNNVPTDLSEIKVTFDKKIDMNSVDTGSLSVFADNCGNAFCNDPDIQDVSVGSKSVTFSMNSNDHLSPDTNYIARVSSHIQDEDGNFLDCANSNAVDSNCEWNFSTSGNTSNPTISINPASGPVGTSVTVTGNGFDPISTVAITFSGSSVSTVTPTSNGGFNTTFNVPLSSSIGDQTVEATQGSKSASKTFTVTSSGNPTVTVNPNFGPSGTSVEITGINYQPNSQVKIFFFAPVTDTLLSTVTTDISGGFSAHSMIPNELPGQYTIEAFDEGSNTDTTIFTVTNSTGLPSTNQLQRTNAGESIATQGILPF